MKGEVGGRLVARILVAMPEGDLVFHAAILALLAVGLARCWRRPAGALRRSTS